MRSEERESVEMIRVQTGRRSSHAVLLLLLALCFASAQARRKVIINQDCSGPGGSNLQTLLVMIQSPQVEVLGITVVSGDQWRDEELAHTLRLLEIIGRTDIPVVPGAAFPLVRTHEEAQQRAPGPLAGGTTPPPSPPCRKGSQPPSPPMKMPPIF